MGGLPLCISIVPAESVATGDVGRALTGPIFTGEVVGSAALPAVAAWAAASVGRPAVLMAGATGVLALLVIAWLLRPTESDDGRSSSVTGGEVAPRA